MQETAAKTTSGLYIPETAAGKAAIIAKVLAVGPGRMNYNGVREPIPVQVGDTVLLNDYSGIPLQSNTNEPLTSIVRSEEILGKLQ